MQCLNCNRSFLNEGIFYRHTTICNKNPSLEELKAIVLFLLDKTDRETPVIQMPVLSSSDLQLVLKGGYEEVIEAHKWPFQVKGKSLYKEHVEVTEEELKLFFQSIFKQIEDMFQHHVNINKWMECDPHGKFPMYSLKIYTRNLKKLKSVLINQCK